MFAKVPKQSELKSILTEEERVDVSAFFGPSIIAQIITTRSAKLDFLMKILSEALTYYFRLLTL
jgi:hypothetical protein